MSLLSLVLDNNENCIYVGADTVKPFYMTETQQINDIIKNKLNFMTQSIKKNYLYFIVVKNSLIKKTETVKKIWAFH